MEKLSFKDYLNSKEVLRSAITAAPIRTAVYEIKKRCTLATGDYVEEGSNIQLKPRQKLIIRWMLSGKIPSITNITLENENAEEMQLSTHWGEKRFIKWLSKNTKQSSQ